MSEQKESYMAVLNAWSEKMIIMPLLESGEAAIPEAEKAIREKVLESYKNGCKAGAGAVRKELQKGRK